MHINIHYLYYRYHTYVPPKTLLGPDWPAELELRGRRGPRRLLRHELPGRARYMVYNSQGQWTALSFKCPFKESTKSIKFIVCSSKFSGFSAYFQAHLVDLVDFLKGHSLKGQSTASMNNPLDDTPGGPLRTPTEGPMEGPARPTGTGSRRKYSIVPDE